MKDNPLSLPPVGGELDDVPHGAVTPGVPQMQSDAGVLRVAKEVPMDGGGFVSRVGEGVVSLEGVECRVGEGVDSRMSEEEMRVEVRAGEGCEGRVLLEVARPSGGVVKELGQVLPESQVSMAELDNNLDLCEAQPLRNMSFLLPKENEKLGKDLEGSEMGEEGGKWAKLKEVNIQDCVMGEMVSNEEFPPLSKRSPRSMKIKGRPPSPIQREKGIVGSGVPGSSAGVVQSGKSVPEMQKNSKSGGAEVKKGVEQKHRYADIIKKGEKTTYIFSLKR